MVLLKPVAEVATRPVPHMLAEFASGNHESGDIARIPCTVQHTDATFVELFAAAPAA
jgi:hypothetical protein